MRGRYNEDGLSGRYFVYAITLDKLMRHGKRGLLKYAVVEEDVPRKPFRVNIGRSDDNEGDEEVFFII